MSSEEREIADAPIDVESLLPMVRTMAQNMQKSLRRNTVSIEELFQSGVVGLLQCRDRYDPSYGVAFTDYAKKRINGEMIKHLRSIDIAPRSSRRMEREITSNNLNLKQELHRTPTHEEEAERLGLTMEEFQKRRARAHIDVRGLGDILPPYPGNTENHYHYLESYEFELPDYSNNPESAVEEAELLRMAIKTLDLLPHRSKQVLTLLFYEDRTEKEVGQMLNLTESRISQLKTQAIKEMREIMNSAPATGPQGGNSNKEVKKRRSESLPVPDNQPQGYRKGTTERREQYEIALTVLKKHAMQYERDCFVVMNPKKILRQANVPAYAMKHLIDFDLLVCLNPNDNKDKPRIYEVRDLSTRTNVDHSPYIDARTSCKGSDFGTVGNESVRLPEAITALAIKALLPRKEEIQLTDRVQELRKELSCLDLYAKKAIVIGLLNDLFHAAVSE